MRESVNWILRGLRQMIAANSKSTWTRRSLFSLIVDFNVRKDIVAS